MLTFLLRPSSKILAPLWLIIVSTLILFAPSASQASILSFSHACAGTFAQNPGNCLDDSHFGDPAISSASRGATLVETDGSGGINYSAQAAGVGVPGQFSLFAHAGGTSDGSDIGIGFASGSVIVQFSDVITIAGGSGTGILRIPWATDGGVALSGTSGANFGVSFCQLIPAGSQVGGIGCNGYPNLIDTFSTGNADYQKTWNLDFQFQFSSQPVDYVLNTTFSTSAGVAAPTGIATSDFAHTGAQQPAQFLDNFGNPITGVTITAQSGLDYFNPQAGPAVSVPEPASIALLALGLAWLGFMRHSKSRAASSSRRSGS